MEGRREDEEQGVSESQRLQACNHKELSSTKILDLKEEPETQMRWQSADALSQLVPRLPTH